MYENNVIILPKVQENKNKKQTKKKTKSISPLLSKTKNGGPVLLSKCAVCNTKKSRFIKNQEAKGLLSNLGNVLF